MKNLSKPLLIILIISVFIISLNYVSGYGIGIKNVWQTLGYTTAYVFLNLHGIWLMHILLERTFPGERYLKKRTLIGVISALGICVFTAILINTFAGIFIYGRSLEEVVNIKIIIEQSLIPVLIGVIITLFSYLAYFYKELYQKKNKEQAQVIQKISLQYKELQQQLSPHFLFNSLNVLDSLIEENPKSAQEFTQELSQVYRYVLEQQDRDFTTIKEELDFARNYVNLMSKRFEGAIELVIADDINADEKIFPLSIQLLIENAFKHNEVSELNPLKIEISQKDNCLHIKNNLMPKKSTLPSSKKGLFNIQTRYQELGLNIRIDETKKYFEVELPIINKNIKIMNKTVEQKEKAYERVEELKKVYKTLVSYIITVLICIAVNLITLGDKIFTEQGFNYRLLWVVWVIVPWGIVILGKALMLFWMPNSKDNWEEEKIREILNK